MRFVLTALVAACCLVGVASTSMAGTFQGNGSYSGTPSPAVVRVFAAFPNGGDGLVAAIRQLLINDPSLAADVAYLGARGNGDQQLAAGDGMRQAFTVLINRGDTTGAALVVSAAQQSGSSTIQAAIVNAMGGSLGLNTFEGSNAAAAGTNCTATVSPARSC